MSGSGRKHVSKWDYSKEDTHHQPSIDENSGSHYRDKDPSHHVLFNADSKASRRSEEDHQHSRQDRARSRVSQNNDNSYYPKQDETWQQFSHRSDSRSYSRSRSRSRSPVCRARRDHHAGSYDRHKTRTRDEFNKRGGDPRETRYHHSNDFRGARSSDYDDEDTEGRYRREHLQHDGVSDPRLRRQRSELTAGEKEKQRRGYDGDGEGRFRRSWEIPCKFFAAGNCRNGQHCRFSHHGGADRNQNNFYRQDNNNYHKIWNGDERSSKGASEAKGNGGSSWIGDMEMSPDWNYGAHSLKKRINEEESGQSSKSRVDDQRSSDMHSYGDNKPMVEKLRPDFHQNYNNVGNTAPLQAYNHNHPAAAAAAAAATDFSVGLNLSHPESVKAYQDNHHSVVEKAVPVQSGHVTREQIDQISKISATIAHFLANGGQPIPQLTQTLQMPLLSQPSMATQINSVSNKGLGVSTDADGAPPVTDASQVSNVDGVQELPVAPEENRDTKTTNEEASKQEECKKTGEDGDEDDDESSGEEEDKKEMKDPKGMRTFKFALVEIVKELLKPAWKEGKMKKDGYKNIVKKVVEKVTGSMQSGNVPTTQEKIDHYLSASKPKLTKLVQAYISKVKKT